MKLEANLEFRFPIWGIFHGATFFDVGNIWFMGNSAEEDVYKRQILLCAGDLQ